LQKLFVADTCLVHSGMTRFGQCVQDLAGGALIDGRGSTTAAGFQRRVFTGDPQALPPNSATRCRGEGQLAVQHGQDHLGTGFGPSTFKLVNSPRATPNASGVQDRSVIPSGVTSEITVAPANVTSSNPSSPLTTAARVEPSSRSAAASCAPQFGPTDAQQLERSGRRIAQWPQQIEDRGYSQPLAHCGHVPHGGVQLRCEAETDPHFVQTSFDSRHIGSDIHPQDRQHIGRSGSTGHPRLPCLATGTPQAAVTNAAAVLMLKVCDPSPPVPQVSSRRVWRVRMGVICRRMVRAAPAISSTVSPLARKASKNSAIRILLTITSHDRIDHSRHLVHAQ
jgi:hypothetical protein